jgi:hypothetical protein
VPPLKSKQVSLLVFHIASEPLIVDTTASGERHQSLVNGKLTPEYALVQGIFTGVVAAFTLVMTIIGPE